MATNVFNATKGDPIVLRAGKAIIKIDKTTIIALGLTVVFQREVQVVPAIGEKRVLSVGEPQGTITAQTLIVKGANDPSGAFHLGDDGCKPYACKITFNDGACDAQGKDVTCSGCVTSAVQITAQGGRGFIGSDFTATFTNLEM